MNGTYTNVIVGTAPNGAVDTCYYDIVIQGTSVAHKFVGIPLALDQCPGSTCLYLWSIIELPFCWLELATEIQGRFSKRYLITNATYDISGPARVIIVTVRS